MTLRNLRFVCQKVSTERRSLSTIGTVSFTNLMQYTCVYVYKSDLFIPSAGGGQRHE